MRLLAGAAGRPRIALRLNCRYSCVARRALTNNGFFRVADEVRAALHAHQPVVALETTIYTHGFPYPDNVALAARLESIVRAHGGVPATIGILDGIAHVGMHPDDLIRLVSSAGQENTLKLSRRDLSYVGGMRLADRRFHGGTTISATMLLAHLAGIRVFGTGGLGGVHRGAESTMDISADLTELGRTPVAVIASGCKSFLDIPRTMEYLETQGVGVATFADGRTGTVDFPAFWSRDSGVKSPNTIADESEAAAIIHAQNQLHITSGLLFANPVPEAFAIPKPEMDAIIEDALRQADALKISGKDNTPFVLAKIKELSKGKSIPANQALIESNVKRATIVARELAILDSKQEEAQGRPVSFFTPLQSSSTNAEVPTSTGDASLPTHHAPSSNHPAPIPSGTLQSAEIVVAGALAVDFACDYTPLSDSPSQTEPLPHTSNPAVIKQTLGGVAHNIAKAAHFLGSHVRLYSAVGDDLSGRAALSQLQEEDMSVSGIETLPPPARTAQYIAINNANKDLSMAVADMSILEQIPQERITSLATIASASPPSVFIADANWTSSALVSWLHAFRHPSTTTIFEPVSTAKALRIFSPMNSQPNPVHPLPPLADIITPNAHELSALHAHALSTSLFDSPHWFAAIDALGIPATGLRVPLAHATSSSLVDQGIPQMAIKLLPFFPTVLVKLGAQGVVLVKMLGMDARELHDEAEKPFILARNPSSSSSSSLASTSAAGNDCTARTTTTTITPAGLYIRLFPPETALSPREMRSVNGAGDSFCGAIAVALSRGVAVQDAVGFAQRAAGLTLKSAQSVSEELRGLSLHCS